MYAICGVGLQGCTRFWREERSPPPYIAGVALLRTGKKVATRDAALFEDGEHLGLRAAGEAVQQDAAVRGFAETQVWGITVVVGGAEGKVLTLAVRTGGDPERLQCSLHGPYVVFLSNTRNAPPAFTIMAAWSGPSSSMVASSPQAARSESKRRRARNTRRSKTINS